MHPAWTLCCRWASKLPRAKDFRRRCVFSLQVTTVCLAEVVVCVAAFTFSNLVHWVDPVYLQHMVISKIRALQAKRKDMVTNSKSSTHQCQLVGLQIQPAAGDGIVGGNQKRPVAQRFGWLLRWWYCAKIEFTRNRTLRFLFNYLQFLGQPSMGAGSNHFFSTC